MPSAHRTIHNIQYSIPRVMVSMSASQNRLLDTDLRLTPGMTEVIEFVLTNQDGIPISLNDMSLKFVVWSASVLDTNKLSLGQSDIVLAKTIPIDDPYASRYEMLLSDEETIRLGHTGSPSLRWSLFAINSDRQVFAMTVSRSGGRYGTLILDLDSGIPVSEIILNA